MLLALFFTWSVTGVAVQLLPKREPPKKQTPAPSASASESGSDGSVSDADSASSASTTGAESPRDEL